MANFQTHPLTETQQKLLSELTATLTITHIAWLSGYFSGLSSQFQSAENNVTVDPVVPVDVQTEKKTLTILYGSRTGNGESIAKQAHKNAIAAGFDAKLKSMEIYKNNDLKNEKNILLIVSTHGEGEAPFQAKTFYDFLHSKRAPVLNGVNFSVLALGDRSYLRFCQTGIEFDNRLEELGATRIHPRVDCDVNFKGDALQWLSGALDVLKDKNDISPVNNSEIETYTESDSYDKFNPFEAEVLDKTFLHGRGSNRQTLHVELSLENSGLEYEPGDSLGVYATNPPELVVKIIETVKLNPSEKVSTPNGELPLNEALLKYYELTQITPDVLIRFEKLTHNEDIKQIIESPESVKEFIYGKDLIDLFSLYPIEITAGDFVSLLRPLQPRLYSISSSSLAYPDEVHLTVGVVKYKNQNRDKTGLCSVFLSDRVVEGEKAHVFIEKNNNFRLPKNDETPIIMVGAGTGIAPYRAFIQHREARVNSGKSWLIFGNRFSESEFLYQLEWQRLLKEGSLTRMNVAFSRDSDEKVYVQNRILEQGDQLFQWLEEGAHFYVCGDMKKMAHDVHNALLKVIQQFGNMNEEAAEEYVLKLQQEHRYQTDVY